MKTKIGLILSMLALVMAAACATPTQTTAAPAAAVEDAVLVISGAADAGFSMEDLQAMPVTDAEYTNKDGETSAYSGVRFADLLAAAGATDYASVSLVAADEYTAEVDQADLDACPTCIVSIDDDGTLRAVMPGMSSAKQVKYLVEIAVN